MHFSNLSLQLGSGLFGHQVFDFVGGLVLLLLGAAITYTLAVWRLRGLQVDGEVVGVRRRGPSFHGVYRYAAPDGRSREATSVQGRNDPRALQTGWHVPISVMPDRPDEARERHAPLSWSLGIGSLLAGAWLVFVGATVSQRSPIVWALILLAVASVLRWLWRRAKALLAKMQPIPAPDSWSAQPIELAESLGAQPTSPLRLEVDGAGGTIGTGSKTRRSGILFIVLGLGVLGLAWWQARGLLELRHGVRTSGQVVQLSEGSADRSGDTSLFPVVQYTGPNGRLVRFDDRTGARPSPFTVGETVPVMVLPGRPDTAAIDRGWSNWEPLAGLAVMGLVMTGLGLVAVRRT